MEEEDYSSDMDDEILSSMWPENLGKESDKQFKIDKPAADQDMLDEVSIAEEPSIVDFKRLMELTDFTEKGSSQLSYLVKEWEHKQANAFRLLNEQIDMLNKQKQEAELKELKILVEHMFEADNCAGDKRAISILQDDYTFGDAAPRFNKDVLICKNKWQADVEHDSIEYWKERAKKLEKLLDESLQRENKLQEKLQENLRVLAKETSPVEELSQILRRADNFLHFILQNAPVVIGHQDKELRYRFIYNHFPSLHEEDIIGRTDVEIFAGAGVKEAQDFKAEVLQRGLPAKREIAFETELFGTKTFLIYVEPVFSKTGETIGVNYMGMDITEQVEKREKLAKLREEIAVRNAMETELNKTIDITEQTMRAKQMLATMSHEIRSPLTGVVGMAEILSTTKLDPEQQQLLGVMISSGDLVLQLINDILDLSKFESGAMKLEATNFRPREVVRHVLQTAAASLQKELTLEGLVTKEVPSEVIGDVLRIRQILTNLISNAIKFTHEGKVGITLQVTSQPSFVENQKDRKDCGDFSSYSKTDVNAQKNDTSLSQNGGLGGDRSSNDVTCGIDSKQCRDAQNRMAKSETRPLSSIDGDEYLDIDSNDEEKIVWLHCDVYDSGIGIPEKALPALFKKYMQVSTAHARKYGGTGLGLAICKQLVELMGGRLTVTSKEHCGSTFSFVVPCKVPKKRTCDEMDNDLLYDMPLSECETSNITAEDDKKAYFQFKPRTLGSLFSSGDAAPRSKVLSAGKIDSNHTSKMNGIHTGYMFLTGESTPSSNQNISLNHDVDKLHLELGSNTLTGIGNVNKAVNDRPSNDDYQHLKITHPPMTTEKDTTLRDFQESQDLELSNLAHENRGKMEKPNQKPPENISDARQTQSRPKILLVEDNKVNVMVTQSMMKRLGHSLDVVSNGAKAVQAVQTNNYDLVLMDVCMPVMDGLEATQLIRKWELSGNQDASEVSRVGKADCLMNIHTNGQKSPFPRKRVPIVAMTANALAEGIAECYANGMDSFIAKPVTFQKLKETLCQYITG